MLKKAATPISIPGSVLGVIVRERLLDLTYYMSNREAAYYVAWYYGGARVRERSGQRGVG